MNAKHEIRGQGSTVSRDACATARQATAPHETAPRETTPRATEVRATGRRNQSPRVATRGLSGMLIVVASLLSSSALEGCAHYAAPGGAADFSKLGVVSDAARAASTDGEIKRALDP